MAQIEVLTITRLFQTVKYASECAEWKAKAEAAEAQLAAKKQEAKNEKVLENGAEEQSVSFPCFIPLRLLQAASVNDVLDIFELCPAMMEHRLLDFSRFH